MVASQTSSTSTPQRPLVPLPIDDPPSDEDELIRALNTCPDAELRRAQCRHRRALEALTSGRYEALSDDIRSDLVDQLRARLKALHRARQSSDASSRPSTSSASDEESTRETGLWSALRDLW